MGVLLAGLPLIGGAGVGVATFAQQPPVARSITVTPPIEGGSVAGQDTDSESSVRRWIDDLRSDSFAVRETASEKLFQTGYVALEPLREARKKSQDAEQLERLSQIISTLAEQSLELRIKRFLRGGESDLENWDEVETWFGDSPRVRELYIDLYREHPYVVECLDGTAQERSLALSMVRRRVLDRSTVNASGPRRTDLIAMLLVMTQPDYNADTLYDRIVVSLLQVHSAYEFRSDPIFGDAFGRMVSQWMSESDLSLRVEVLHLALDWKMEVALPLALKSLDQNPDPELICRCMQAIARQGQKKHAARLAEYLDDSTVVYRPQYLGGHGGDVQIGDVAAAAIARLFDMSVTEIGFARPAEHEVLGIFYEELSIPANKPGEKPVASDEPDAQEDTEEVPGADSDSEADSPPLPMEALDGTPVQDPRTWKQFQRLREASLRREAARQEIRAKARELVSKLPAEISEKS